MPYLLIVLLLLGCANTTSQTPDSQDASSLMAMAQQAAANGDGSAALGLLQRAAAMDDKNLDIQLTLGQLYRQQGKPREALQHFRQALTITPTHRGAMLGGSMALLELDQPENALPWLQSLVKADAKDREAHNIMAVARDMLGQHGAAQAIYQQLLRQYPEDLELLNNLGFSLLLSQQPGPAATLLEAAVKSPAATSQHRQNLALAYVMKGEEQRAQAMLAQDYPASKVGAVLQRLREAVQLRRQLPQPKAAPVAPIAASTLAEKPSPAKPKKTEEKPPARQPQLPLN